MINNVSGGGFRRGGVSVPSPVTLVEHTPFHFTQVFSDALNLILHRKLHSQKDEKVECRSISEEKLEKKPTFKECQLSLTTHGTTNTKIY